MLFDNFIGTVSRCRWADVQIIVEDVNNSNNQIVGKRSTSWTHGDMLSYSRTEYDVAGRVERVYAQHEDGNEYCTTQYTYDKAGRQIEVIDLPDDDQKRAVTTTHYQGTRRDYVTDACDNTTYFTYDILGRLITTQYPDTATGTTYTHTGFDAFGRKTWESRQTTKTLQQLTAEDKKELEYDSTGRLIAVTLPQVAEMERPDHNGTMLTNARARFEYVYDASGNLIEQWDNIYVQGENTIDTYARATTFAYNELSLQISRTLPDSSVEYKEYDDFGRIYFAKDFKGQVTGFEYNNLGQLEYKKYYTDQAAYDAQSPSETIRYIYDNLGRRRQIIEAEGTTTYEYDAEGNILGVDSPQGTVNYDYALVTNRKVATWTADTWTQYEYDQIGRLKAAELVKLNGGSVSKLTTYEYTTTGNRYKMHLPNSITTTYANDSINRLLSVTHDKASQLAKYNYTLAADGMRTQLVEDISTGGGRTVDYTYDNLNRVISETSNEATGDYFVEYTHDVVGNRTRRIISANGQCMQTDYEYNNMDQLVKETHTDPGVCLYLNDKPVYAYSANGRITHYRMFGSPKDIGPFKAYLLGIPSKWSNYIVTAILGLLPVTFFLISHRGLRAHRVKYFLRQCLIITLAYTMLINPAWLYQEAQAAINYSNLSTANWGTTNRDIHYYYDENGSCIKKIEAVKDTADPNITFIEKTVYVYNLQNRLEEVKVTTDGSNWDVTTYKYNDDGIRVEKNDNGTVTKYLIDSYNHTGYAQVLEEWTDETLTRTYIIGDDIIGEADNSSIIKYLLRDGQDSVRHHTNSSGSLVAYTGCDTFAYDAYGQRVDPLKDSVNDGLFYTSQRWDESAQMYYLRARYYNPLTGLFNQIDPFSGNRQDPQSLHKYLYCHANPVNATDPEALDMFIAVSGGDMNIVAGVIAMDVTAIRNMLSTFKPAAQNVVTLVYRKGSLQDFWNKARRLQNAARGGGVGVCWGYNGDAGGI